MSRRRVTVKKRRRSGWRGRGEFWFDAAEAARRCEFIETFCTHTKGEWSGRPFILEPWQRHMIEELFGWKRRDGATPAECTRQYRTLWLELPRKNGKSAIAAPIALSLLFLDDEGSPEIYGAASDREQASIVFETAKQMIRNEAELDGRVTIFGGMGGMRRSIVLKSRPGFYRVISSEASGAHGLSPSGAIVDEVHVHKSRELIDAIATGTGARRQPLTVYITTSGDDRLSIAYELHDYAMKLIEGTINDPSFLPFVYGTDPADDWTDPAVWAQANPNLGVSVKLEYLEQQCERAKASPGYQNTFRRLHLNQWTEQASRWLDVGRWKRCAGPVPWHELAEHLAGREAYGGLDLASTIDLASWALAFPPVPSDPHWYLVVRHWIPEDNVRERVKRDRVPYDQWIEAGAIETTSGSVTDYDVIRRAVNDDAEIFDIREIAADRWEATHLISQLEGDGHDVMAHGQGFRSYKDPCRQFEGHVRAARIAHGGNPVMQWQIGNVAVRTDEAGNMKPDKKRSGEKIDGVVASIMAVGRAMLALAEDGDTQGIVVL